MSDVATAVAGTITDLFGAAPDEAPATPVNSPTDAAADEPQDAALELPSVPDLPEDLAEFLDEPDFDEEITSTSPVDEDEFVDPDELARRLAIAEKRLAFAEQKRAEAERNKWVTEAQKFFPFADASKITATSRRAFLRQARDAHQSVASHVTPLLADIEAAKEAARKQAYEEAKVEAASAWGKPNLGGGPSGAPVEAADAADRLDAARNSRNMTKVVKALMEGNRI